MAGILENVLLLGLGSISLGKSTAENLIRETLKKNNISDADSDSILKTISEEGKKTKELLEQSVENVIKTRGLSLMPGYDRMQKMEERIEKLEKELAALKGESEIVSQ